MLCIETLHYLLHYLFIIKCIIILYYSCTVFCNDFMMTLIDEEYCIMLHLLQLLLVSLEQYVQHIFLQF